MPMPNPSYTQGPSGSPAVTNITPLPYVHTNHVGPCNPQFHSLLPTVHTHHVWAVLHPSIPKHHTPLPTIHGHAIWGLPTLEHTEISHTAPYCSYTRCTGRTAPPAFTTPYTYQCHTCSTSLTAGCRSKITSTYTPLVVFQKKQSLIVLQSQQSADCCCPWLVVRWRLVISQRSGQRFNDISHFSTSSTTRSLAASMSSSSSSSTACWAAEHTADRTPDLN